MVSSLFCWHHVRRNSDSYSSSQVFFEKPCMLEKVQVRLHPSCPPTPFPTPNITTHPTDIIMRYLVYVHIFNQTFRLGRWSSVVPSQWQMMCTQTRYPSSPGDCFDVKTLSFPYVSNIRSLATVIYIYILTLNWKFFILQQSVLMPWTTCTGDLAVYHCV